MSAESWSSPVSRLSAGDVLAEVESLQLRTVQLDLLQTLTEVRLAEQSLQRFEGLSGQNVMPKRQALGIAEQPRYEAAAG